MDVVYRNWHQHDYTRLQLERMHYIISREHERRLQKPDYYGGHLHIPPAFDSILLYGMDHILMAAQLYIFVFYECNTPYSNDTFDSRIIEMALGYG